MGVDQGIELDVRDRSEQGDLNQTLLECGDEINNWEGEGRRGLA